MTNQDLMNNYIYGNSTGIYGIGTYMSDNISIINNTFDIFGGNLSEIDKFTEGKVKNHESVLIIPTLGGDMYASLNDYIIKGVNGEFYPCKHYIFVKTYEEVIV